MKKEIQKWIDDFVSVHNPAYGQTPCPYARAAKVKYVRAKNIAEALADVKNNWTDDFEVVCIYTATKNYTPWMTSKLVDVFNMEMMYTDLVALEDHPDDKEIINGVQMNFGKCILVLVQRLSKLNEASNILKEKGYYDNWSKENVDDTVAWRFSW